MSNPRYFVLLAWVLFHFILGSGAGEVDPAVREEDDFKQQMREAPNRGRGNERARRVKKAGSVGERAGKWPTNIAKLEEYRQLHGDTMVPLGHVTEDGIKLGRWLSAVQKAWILGKMSPERAARLDELGVTKEVPKRKVGKIQANEVENSKDGSSADNPKQNKLSKMMKAVAKYKQANGNLKVPWDYTTETEDGEELKLGLFLKSIGEFPLAHSSVIFFLLLKLFPLYFFITRYEPLTSSPEGFNR